MNKNFNFIIVALMLSLIIGGCSFPKGEMENEFGTIPSGNMIVNSSNAEEKEEIIKQDAELISKDSDEINPAKVYAVSGNILLKLSKYDQLVYYNPDTATIIEGNAETGEVNVTGNGAIVSENRIMLTEQGTYIMRGEFIDKFVYVDTELDKKVHLVLEGANITSQYTSPIWAAYGDKLIITLSENTVNTLSDTNQHNNDTANGCLFSDMDTTINGSGRLIVNGNYNNGISVKKDLKIYGSSISINAVNNGIKGNNSVSIIEGNVAITANDDGIKTTEENDLTKGFIFISDSVVEITAQDDILQAVNACVIRDGAEVRGRSYGSFINCKIGYVEGEEYTKSWQ